MHTHTSRPVMLPWFAVSAFALYLLYLVIFIVILISLICFFVFLLLKLSHRGWRNKKKHLSLLALTLPPTRTHYQSHTRNQPLAHCRKEVGVPLFCCERQGTANAAGTYVCEPL